MSSVATPAPKSREQVILDHLPQVKIIAARFHPRCPPQVLLEDLVRGVVGLLDGYRRFDARRNLRFNTFAEHRIRGAIVELPPSARFTAARHSAVSEGMRRCDFATLAA
jgi:DNA-directed RNA polymerase specialized sigma subunit